MEEENVWVNAATERTASLRASAGSRGRENTVSDTPGSPSPRVGVGALNAARERSVWDASLAGEAKAGGGLARPAAARR